MNQEPIKPDYNYILQQQTPESTRPKRGKATYVLFGSLLILGAFALIAITLSALIVKDANSPEMIRSHADASSLFIKSMSTQDYSSIIDSQLASSLKQDNKAANQALLERFGSTTNFESCAAQTTTADKDGSFQNIYICDGISGSTKKKVTIVTVETGGAYKVKGHRVEKYES